MVSCYQARAVIYKFLFVCFSVFLVSFAKIVTLRFSCTKILGYKTHPISALTFHPKTEFPSKNCAPYNRGNMVPSLKKKNPWFQT